MAKPAPSRLFRYDLYKWTVRKCHGCGRTRDCLRGRCLPCRQPPDRRALVEVGVPCSSADALAWIVQKAKRQRKTGAEIEAILWFVHPLLMENIEVTDQGVLRPKVKKAEWIRRNGWTREK